jgi:2-polyprenylphenol 6-hydroxylase
MTTKDSVKADIVIAGGGPVGLAAACALAESGLQILLVDAGKEVIASNELGKIAVEATFDQRVSALTVASQSFLDKLGAWELIKSVRLCPFAEMHVWDGEGTGAIHFSAAEIHAPSLGHIVENRLLTTTLSEVAKTKPQLKFIHQDKITGIETGQNQREQGNSPVCVTLASGQVIETKLLIGADGGNSFIREQGGFSLRQWEYGHKAIVTTVKTEKPHQYTAWQRFMKTGPLAFLPLHLPGLDAVEQQYCSIVWSCVTEKADELLTLDDEAFKESLGKAFEFRLGTIESVDKRVSFPLWQRHATDYVMENIALIGDAAHTIHPLAGQGVNLGFADTQALCEVICAALDKGEDYASHQVLSRYQRNRKGKNLAMMAAMEGFKRLFESEDLMVKWLRNSGLNMTDTIPAVKGQLMRAIMGL